MKKITNLNIPLLIGIANYIQTTCRVLKIFIHTCANKHSFN